MSTPAPPVGRSLSRSRLSSDSPWRVLFLGCTLFSGLFSLAPTPHTHAAEPVTRFRVQVDRGADLGQSFGRARNHFRLGPARRADCHRGRTSVGFMNGGMGSGSCSANRRRGSVSSATALLVSLAFQEISFSKTSYVV